MILATTVNKLCEMRLSAMAECFRAQLQDAAFEPLAFEERFSLIVDTGVCQDSCRMNLKNGYSI